MTVQILALECKECKQRFCLCRDCYRGQRYCSDKCRKLARYRQCRVAQLRYLEKRKGRKRRAAAVAAYRKRARHDSNKNVAGQKCNRSTYRKIRLNVSKPLPLESCCELCGRIGPVREWH
jgi:hypothetical protein